MFLIMSFQEDKHTNSKQEEKQKSLVDNLISHTPPSNFTSNQFGPYSLNRKQCDGFCCACHSSVDWLKEMFSASCPWGYRIEGREKEHQWASEVCFLENASCMKLLAGAGFQDEETASMFSNHTSANYIQKYVMLSGMIGSILPISTYKFSP